MKKKVLIIEDNSYSYFTTKQVLMSQMRLNVEVRSAGSAKELVEAADEINPDQIMFRPQGGIAELMVKLKRRNVNRRNTEIILISAADIDTDSIVMAQKYLAAFKHTAKAA